MNEIGLPRALPLRVPGCGAKVRLRHSGSADSCLQIRVPAVRLGDPLRLQLSWVSVSLSLRRGLRGRWNPPQKPGPWSLRNGGGAQGHRRGPLNRTRETRACNKRGFLTSSPHCDRCTRGPPSAMLGPPAPARTSALCATGYKWRGYCISKPFRGVVGSAFIGSLPHLRLHRGSNPGGGKDTCSILGPCMVSVVRLLT